MKNIRLLLVRATLRLGEKRINVCIYGDRINHVGILLDTVSGKTPFVHATSSRGVRIDYLKQDYYAQRLVGVRTVVER